MERLASIGRVSITRSEEAIRENACIGSSVKRVGRDRWLGPDRTVVTIPFFAELLRRQGTGISRRRRLSGASLLSLAKMLDHESRAGRAERGELGRGANKRGRRDSVDARIATGGKERFCGRG